MLRTNPLQIEARPSLRWQAPPTHLVGGFLGLLRRCCLSGRRAPTTNEAARIGRPTAGGRNSSNCTGELTPDSGGGQTRLSSTQCCVASEASAEEKGGGSGSAGMCGVRKEASDEAGEKHFLFNETATT